MGIHRWPVNSMHTGPVTRKKLPLDDVLMISAEISFIVLNLQLVSDSMIPKYHQDCLQLTVFREQLTPVQCLQREIARVHVLLWRFARVPASKRRCQWPADTLCNNDVVITPKRRHCDVITTLSLRHVFVGCKQRDTRWGDRTSNYVLLDKNLLIQWYSLESKLMQSMSVINC